MSCCRDVVERAVGIVRAGGTTMAVAATGVPR